MIHDLLPIALLLAAAATLAVYALGALYAWSRRGLEGCAYPAPEDAQRETEALARRHPEVATLESLGRSAEGRPLHVLRLRGTGGPPRKPCLLVTAQIHAAEFVASYVARSLAVRLVQNYGRDSFVTRLLDRAEIWIAPLLNPDGAERVWRAGGWTGLKGARFTSRGVDPNRNFPPPPVEGRRGWNTASERPGSPYYRGPHPLSEPECRALADLCRRERFCAAVNFHSFGSVVFIPGQLTTGDERARNAAAVFQGTFQSYQSKRKYRPVIERPAKIAGQLDAYLYCGLGTPSVTVEVSRPGRYVLHPTRLFNLFWWANPPDPLVWVENDADATIHALLALLDATRGSPCQAPNPELADW